MRKNNIIFQVKLGQQGLKRVETGHNEANKKRVDGVKIGHNWYKGVKICYQVSKYEMKENLGDIDR